MYVKVQGSWEKAAEPKKDRYVVATDFDGVVTDPHQLKAKEISRLGYPISPEESSRDYCTQVMNVPLNIYEKATYSVNVCGLEKVPPEKDVKRVIESLRTYCRFYIVTSRLDHEMDSVFNYLDKHGISCDGVVNTNRSDKLAILSRIKPDVYIEDTPEKIYPLLLKGTSGEWISVDPLLAGCRILFYRNAANQYFREVPKFLTEVSGWTEIENIVGEPIR